MRVQIANLVEILEHIVGYIGLQHGFNTSKGLGTVTVAVTVRITFQDRGEFLLDSRTYTKWHVRLDWLGMAPSASKAHSEPHPSNIRCTMY